MTRKEFFKKLGIGVAAIVVAPKTLIPSQKEVLTTGGVIPHIVRPGKLRYTAHKFSSPSIISKMQPYMEDIQMDWLKMEIAMEKERQKSLYFVRFDKFGNTVEIKRIKP